ncbi:MAG: metallopeptidase TldD-related protein [Bacteroidales bacterium]
MKKIPLCSFTGLLFFLFLFSVPSAVAQSSLVNALSAEISYQMERLQQEPVKPFYIDFSVTDVYTTEVTSNLGSIIRKFHTAERFFSPLYRVGSAEKDSWGIKPGSLPVVAIPIDDNPSHLKVHIWTICNQSFRNAVTAFNREKQQSVVEDDQEAALAVFSAVDKQIYSDKPLPEQKLAFDTTLWAKRLNGYTMGFSASPLFLEARAGLSYVVERKTFVSSEGSAIEENSLRTNLVITAAVQAADGMILTLSENYFAFSPDELPSEAEVLADLERLRINLLALREAPLAEAYVGPALLSGKAAAVFFHEIVGHRLEGKRMRSTKDANTFKSKLGEEVLLSTLSLRDDPTLQKVGNTSLAGHYRYDEEGVAGEPVQLVSNGMIKGFLMTRTPLTGFPKSNGHARARRGYLPVSRQSNLILSTSNPQSDAALRKALKEEVQKQGKEFGYFISQISGGVTSTNTASINSFQITPLMVYRVYADDRPDQLVRGLNFIGTPLGTLTQILAAGADTGVFNGMCGAESGAVPVSAVAPSLLVEKFELQRSRNFAPQYLLSRP